MSVCSEAETIISKRNANDNVLAKLCRHLDDCTLCDVTKAAESLAETALSKRMQKQNPLGQAIIQAQIIAAQTFRKRYRMAGV